MQKQILVVEDNALNRAMLCGILGGEYRMLEAGNGQEALEILQQHRGGIALILLDVMMPVMDGYTFLDRIRGDAELALIPVIVMTQSDSEEDEVAALAHGAMEFIPKPYRPQVLLHRVSNLIEFREAAAMVNQFRYDRLTGLYSKEFFYQKVRQRLDEDPETAYSIVCSNIENFKLFNDTYGREQGDRLLKEVAGITVSMVGSTGFCARFGSDRFLCLQELERERQDRIRFGSDAKQEPSAYLKKTVMRWGIYEITDRSISVEQMCDRAMLAADSIKGQYQNFFAVYDDSLRGRLLREKAITDAMDAALEEKQFEVYFQPKYSLNERRMAGAEALVRWIHPTWGFMSPGEFIPLFEKNGFISRLDRYVWERVCAQLRDWKDRGFALLPVSVNVSRGDVYQDDLEDMLLGLTREYGVDPAYLHLEITESAYTENPDQIIRTVAQLRRLGFVIEMDDFGSGYSSLNMLGQMKLDVLKLDMKFVQNEIAKPSGKRILNDIITMAHKLNLSVVAEGVETQTQMECLQAEGCDYVQGYFLAKPMPVKEYEGLLERWRPQTECPAQGERQGGTDLCRLLVADEDAAYREKVRKAFEDQYCVLEAADAEAVLACLESAGSDGISMVVLSMTLPDDGAARVLRTLRQEPAFWQIPVLATVPKIDMIRKLPLALETDDFLCKSHPLFDLSRRIRCLMELVSLRRRELVLRDEANRDPLTGLLNRRGLQASMTSVRKEEQPLAVFIFDLDDLKKVNDTYGHETGDQMICAFAELLRGKTRAGDVLCRYGGDEFVAVLKRMDDAEKAARKGMDICRAFRRYLEKERLPASCSVGVAMCGVDERPSAELFEHADQALYRAKRENKGNCCLWNEQDMQT